MMEVATEGHDIDSHPPRDEWDLTTHDTSEGAMLSGCVDHSPPSSSLCS